MLGSRVRTPPVPPPRKPTTIHRSPLRRTGIIPIRKAGLFALPARERPSPCKGAAISLQGSANSNARRLLQENDIIRASRQAAQVAARGYSPGAHHMATTFDDLPGKVFKHLLFQSTIKEIKPASVVKQPSKRYNTPIFAEGE